MKYLALFFLTLNSCAVPSYVTRHGIKVYDKTTNISPSQQKIEKVTDLIIEELGEPGNLKNIHITLVSVWLQRYLGNSMVELADGNTTLVGIPYINFWLRKDITISVFQTCFADSSFVHEMAHAMYSNKLFRRGWAHGDKRFWAVKIKNLEKRAIKELCPVNYKHKKILSTFVPHK